MAIYNKSINEITIEDVWELCPDTVKDRASEGVRLEFVSTIESPKEIAKKICGFANTVGGHMIIGAEEGSPRGRIAGLPGVDLDTGLRSRIYDYCFTKVYPPVTAFVSDALPVEDGKYCYVVYIPESPSAPHYLNERDGVFVRVDEQSLKLPPDGQRTKLASATELDNFYLRRKNKEEITDRLFDRSAERFINSIKTTPFSHPQDWEVWPNILFFASPTHPSSTLLEELELYKRFDRRNYSNFHNETLVETDKYDTYGLENSYCERTTWGSYAFSGIISTYLKGDRRIFRLSSLCSHILIGIRESIELFSVIGFDGSVLFRIKITNVLHCQVNYSDEEMMNGRLGQAKYDNHIELKFESNTFDLSESEYGFFSMVVRKIFICFGIRIVLNEDFIKYFLKECYVQCGVELPQS
jgi:hypothetical protein